MASFAEVERAQALAALLKQRHLPVRIVKVDVADGLRYRVQVGRFGSQRQAQLAAEQLARELKLDCLVMRDDDT